MNTVQAKFPQYIHFGDSIAHDTFADKLSIALMNFCPDLYGPTL
jgi:hypothetical protein